MELRDIKYIVSIKKYSSITQAAKELYIPQPTLSNVLKRVETELGKSLFIRTKSGLKLTKSGTHFVQMAEELLAMNDKMMSEMASFSETPKTIRIASPDMWCARLVAPVTAEFFKSYPDVMVNIQEKSTAEIEEGLRKDEIDIGILQLPFLDMDCFDYRPLFDEQIVIAVASDYWKKYAVLIGAQQDSISLKHLENHRLIFTDPERPVRRKIELALKNNRIPYMISAVTNNLEASLVLAEKEVGIAFISDKQKNYYIDQYHLTYVRADQFLPKWQMVAVQKKENHTAIIDSFIREMEAFTAGWDSGSHF